VCAAYYDAMFVCVRHLLFLVVLPQENHLVAVYDVSTVISSAYKEKEKEGRRGGVKRGGMEEDCKRKSGRDAQINLLRS
jgi:hypothetical protein